MIHERIRTSAGPPGTLHPRRPRGVLDDILSRLIVDPGAPVPSIPVHAIVTDADRVEPGDLFVALEGRQPGSIGRAVGRGAVAVIAESGPSSDVGVPVCLVQDAMRALGHMADRLFGHPSRALRTCGVAGSVGKRSVSVLSQAALDAAGLAAGHITQAAGLPRPHRLQERLSRFCDEGHMACVVETAARELVLGRFEGLRFDSAVFVGLGECDDGFFPSRRERLDATADLFRGLSSDAVCALNRDDPSWESIAAETRAKVVTFGLEAGGEVRGQICRMDLGGTRMDVRSPVGTIPLATSLVGRLHATNALAAITGALALGADLDDAVRGISAVRNVPGRMEKLPLPLPFSVLIDVAPDAPALASVLTALRPLVRGRLIVVFGAPDTPSAGWARMANAAERGADALVVTEGRDSGENPLRTIGELMRGLTQPRRAWLEPSRPDAIRMALETARTDDTVLLVSRGNGSEERTVVRDWCLKDLEAAAAADLAE